MIEYDVEYYLVLSKLMLKKKPKLNLGYKKYETPQSDIMFFKNTQNGKKKSLALTFLL